MNEQLLTVKEVANALGVNTETIYREIKKPDCNIPFKKIGGSYRFLLSEILNETKNINTPKNLFFKKTMESGKNPVLWLHFKSNTGKSAMLNLNNIALEHRGITGNAMQESIKEYLNKIK